MTDINPDKLKVIIKPLIIILLSIFIGLILKKESDFVYLLLIAFWVYIGKKFKINYQLFIAAALVLLMLCPVFLIFRNLVVMKIGSMVFLLLLTGLLLR